MYDDKMWKNAKQLKSITQYDKKIKKRNEQCMRSRIKRNIHTLSCVKIHLQKLKVIMCIYIYNLYNINICT